MIKKIFTKKYKKDLVAFGKSFYNVNKEKHKPNPDFEKCRKKGYEHLKCNTCEFRRDCNEGEDTWEENSNIIEELIEEIIRCVENKEQKLKKEVRNS